MAQPSGIKKSLPMARFVFLPNYRLERKRRQDAGWLSRRWRFPILRLPTAEKACRPRKILVVYRKCRTVERISAAPYRFGIDRPARLNSISGDASGGA
jgi:hypothetical protein